MTGEISERIFEPEPPVAERRSQKQHFPVGTSARRPLELLSPSPSVQCVLRTRPRPLHLQKIFLPGGKRQRSWKHPPPSILHRKSPPPQGVTRNSNSSSSSRHLNRTTSTTEGRSKKAAQGSACPQFKVRKQ